MDDLPSSTHPHADPDLIEAILLSVPPPLTDAALTSLISALGRPAALPGEFPELDDAAIHPLATTPSERCRYVLEPPEGARMLLGQIGLSRRPPFLAERTEGFGVGCVTVVGRFAVAVDMAMDEFFWGGVKGVDKAWDDGLDALILDLVLAIDEHLEPMVVKMGSAASFLRGDLDDLTDGLRENFRDALEHKPQALGSLHLNLHQFLEMGTTSLPLVPPALRDAIAAFEKGKLARSPLARLHARLAELRAATAAYAAALAREFGDGDGEARHFCRQLELMDAILQHEAWQGLVGGGRGGVDAVAVAASQVRLAHGADFAFLSTFRYRPLAAMMQAFMPRAGSPAEWCRSLSAGPVRRANFLPVVPLFAVGEPGPEVLDGVIDALCESAVGSTCSLDSLMSFRLGPEMDVANGALLLRHLLRAGLGFVTAHTSGRVFAILGAQNATLALDGTVPAVVRRRARDASRILRRWRREQELRVEKGADGGRLALRVSTAFDTVLEGLREHHQPCWVGPPLERVWRHMHVVTRELVTLELWLVEGDTETLVAADVAFLIGHSVYVATRFALRSHRHLSPGFILGLASTKFLQGLGYRGWDLGATDGSPMMAYKAELAEVLDRPAAIARIRLLTREPSLSSTLPFGKEVVADLEPRHLFGV